MSVRTVHVQKESIYFVTFTCYQWLPLIDKTKLYDFIYRWFDRISQQGISVLGYVIMPNHIHLLLYYPDLPKSLNYYIGEGKRFMAYELIKRLKNSEDNNYLRLLESGVSLKQSGTGQTHRVFINSFDAKECFSKAMTEQKLNYIHENPVSGKWKLVDDYVSYDHSSAGFYELGETTNYPVKHYNYYY